MPGNSGLPARSARDQVRAQLVLDGARAVAGGLELAEGRGAGHRAAMSPGAAAGGAGRRGAVARARMHGSRGVDRDFYAQLPPPSPPERGLAIR